MQQSKPTYRKIVLALFFSCLSGFIDILGLLGIGGRFLSFMSGNSTRFAFHLAKGHWQLALPYLLLLCGFVFGAFLGNTLKAYSKRETFLTVIVAETLLIACSLALLKLYRDDFAYMPLTIAMGLQNVMQIEVNDKVIGRTFFTGILYSLGASLSLLFQRKGSWRSTAVDASLWLVAVLGSFMAGVGYYYFDIPTLLMFVVILLLFIIMAILLTEWKEKKVFIDMKN